MILTRYQHTILLASLGLLGSLSSCSILHQVSPVDINNVSPELSATVGRVEGQVARTRLYEGIASSILPEKSAETRLALYKEEQRKLEVKLIELAYLDVKTYPDYHARTLQELARFILTKSTTSHQNIEFVVSASLKNEFLQYPNTSVKAKDATPQGEDKAGEVPAVQPELQAVEPLVIANPAPPSDSQAIAVVAPELELPAPLNVPKALPEGVPYGKSLDERGKAGLDIYLRHLITIVPILSQQDNEKMLNAYCSDIEICKKASIIDTSRDIDVQYKTIEAVVAELELKSGFVPNTLKVRKQKSELDNIIQFLDDPS